MKLKYFAIEQTDVAGNKSLVEIRGWRFGRAPRLFKSEVSAKNSVVGLVTRAKYNSWLPQNTYRVVPATLYTPPEKQ